MTKLQINKFVEYDSWNNVLPYSLYKSKDNAFRLHFQVFKVHFNQPVTALGIITCVAIPSFLQWAQDL